MTEAQMNDAVYLTSLINSLNTQKQNALNQNTANYEEGARQANMTLQQNLRKQKELNALNGMNGGYEESTYARLLAGANSGLAGLRQQMNDAAYKISSQYDPQIAEYQGYLDRLNALAAMYSGGGGGGGGGGGRKKSSSSSSYDSYQQFANSPKYQGTTINNVKSHVAGDYATNSLAATIYANALKKQNPNYSGNTIDYKITQHILPVSSTYKPKTTKKK